MRTVFDIALEKTPKLPRPSAMRNRTLRWMNIYEETWVCKRTVKSVLHRKSCFFIYKNFSRFFCSFAFLEYHVRESFFFSVFETFCLGKYLCCDRPTMDNSVLFRSIFKEIIQKYILSTSNTTKKILNQKTQRILVFKATRLTALRELVAFRASVPQVFFTGWTEKWPNLVSPVIPKCLW